MVYNKIIIIEGYSLKIDELVDFLELQREISQWSLPKDYKSDTKNLNKEEKIEWIKQNGIYSDKYSNIEIFQPRCCSKSEDYIVGRKIKTYHRISVKCNDCDKYFCCDKCIGLTENGFYDVETILNEVKPIKKNHICKICHNDNKTSSKFKCKFCKFHKLNGECKPKKWKWYNDTIKIWFSNKSRNYYYQLNDCLSCT
ncbi:hypothetical protein QLL95_gp0209 [Cotonvirus japonicus]|uniref:Uncharacterized protein n=1 Tax=Cotonvirus japonicus TaxID=2811091 RepID=A0ABM7NRA6_9VIRU|nr:hypothetical protein QLL95_gp0209 [Cotonvirus japonicus]BCS82698.1 hypothetical protein [Cotonvirus japonicus]